MDAKTNWNLKHDQKYYAYLESDLFRQVYQYAASEMLQKDVQSILDVGCWTGMLPDALLSMKYSGTYLGTDISNKAIAEASYKYRGHDSYRFTEHDFRLKPVEDTFDGMYFGGVFHYVEDKSAFLDKHISRHNPSVIVIQDLVTTDLEFLSKLNSKFHHVEQFDIPMNAYGDKARNKRQVHVLHLR